MAFYIPKMNYDKFMQFMKNPNSNADIINEYKSIISNPITEKPFTPEQNKEVEIKGCLSYLQFLYYGPQLKDNQVIPGASFIDGHDTKRKFLCTKNPQEQDSAIFWQTVWDNQVDMIVMVGQLTDKSYQYWSPKEKNTLLSGNFKIKTRKIVINANYNLTVLSLTATGLKSTPKRSIFHLQYTGWRQGYLPKPRDFLYFYYFVDDMYLQLKNKTPNKKFAPMLIHCSDGLGYSQVYCAIDICITQLEFTQEIKMSQVVEKMREQRHGSINSSDLYLLCYQIIKAMFDDFE